MNRKFLSTNIRSKTFLTLFSLLFTIFTWFQINFIIMNKILEHIYVTYMERIVIYAAYYLSYIMFSLIGSSLAENRKIIYLWITMSITSLLGFILLELNSFSIILCMAVGGIAFGLGLPHCLAYFADYTASENRGKVGGTTFFIISIILPLLSLLPGLFNLNFFLIFSTIWMGAWLIIILLLKPGKKHPIKRIKVSFSSILSKRQFYLFFVSWLIFCIIDNLEVPILRKFLDQTFGYHFESFVLNLGTIVTSFSIIAAGFLIDIYGRKRALIYGFVTLGIAYASIGIAPLSPISWYIYFVINGVAAGFFIVIFVFTVWGDLSDRGLREKYYAIGNAPFFFLVFIRELLTPYVTAIPVSAAFSFASFFLFLAVFPLMYAPETLPEKKIREREVRKYIEKAKKIREKYT